jgi:hypothetical protein
VTTFFSLLLSLICRYFKLIPIFSGSGTPLPLLQLMLVAVALGSLLFPNLVMLFYPVTRGSVVLQASGISYPDAIRCGVGFCLLISLCLVNCSLHLLPVQAAVHDVLLLPGAAVLLRHKRQRRATGNWNQLP